MSPEALRMLKIAIVVMGVMIVILFTIVVAELIRQSLTPTASVGQQDMPLIAAGSTVLGTAGTDNHVSVLAREPDGKLILYVVDLESGSPADRIVIGEPDQ